jgi:hypothetical protein
MTSRLLSVLPILGGQMRHIISVLGGIAISAALVLSPVRAWDADQLSPSYTLGLTTGTAQMGVPDGAGGVIGNVATGSTLGVDTIRTFESYFYDPGFNTNGIHQYTWQFRMVGRAPFNGGEDENDRHDNNDPVTRFRAPVVPVTVDLRNADGSPRFVNGQRLISSPAAYVAPTLASPIFQPTGYSSSFIPTQFTDSILRAEFYGVAPHDWHTLLDPSVQPGLTMVLVAGTYRFALNGDGSCCAFILVDESTFRNALFPAAGPTTVIAQAVAAGYITTQDISTFLFPNTFLYQNGNPSQCCVLGFHNYAVGSGDPSNGWMERRYVFNYSSWVTLGLFTSGWADVTVLSHELTETFNDPFGGNLVPWWLAPNGNCQNNLETGDVIENLPNAIKTIHLGGTVYHVQNEALLQWFAGQTPSTAINGAYSYPDPVLTTASVSQNPDCK